MKRREGKGPPSTDFLVCFPTRAHLTLTMPKPVCSPARPSDSKKNPHASHQQVRHLPHHLKRSSHRSGGGGSGGHGSPYLWSKSKQMGSDISEPTSPKVTCAGQIKVRPRAAPCKNWQSVMEEIERLHNDRKQKKPTWVEGLGFKKEVMQFLTCLRSLKFDFRCFGALPNTDITSDEEEEEDGDDKETSHEKKFMGMEEFEHDQDHEEEGSSKTVFSKWFMVLQENQECGVPGKEGGKLKVKELEIENHGDDNDEAPPPCVPPSNALLLMRCRSAPAKSWLEERQEEEEEEEEEDDEEENDDDDDEDEKKEEKELEIKKRESLMDLMKYETDFYKLSCDIAKETWVVGGMNKDPFSRSRSWKR